MANALSSSQQLLQHLQQQQSAAEQLEPKHEIIGGGEENASGGGGSDGISIVSLINDAVMPSRNLRRKRSKLFWLFFIIIFNPK
jgi:hypothetical protein